MRNVILAGATALALAACSSSGTEGSSGAMPAAGAGMDSLINVNLSDIRAEIAKNVNVNLERVPITIQLPVTVAANVCGVNVNLLSVQVNTAGNSCTATATSPALEQEVTNQIS